jgi:hypothetical protein
MDRSEIQNNSLSEDQNINNELDETEDDELSLERRRIQEQKENMEGSNLFKARVIETEVNSGLWLQEFLYFNFFYNFLAFSLQLSSYVYKYYIYDVAGVSVPGIIIILIWFVQEQARLYFGYAGNLQESVNIIF